MTDRPEASAEPAVRLRDAMPRPLLISFLIVGVLAVALITVLLVHPPRPAPLPLAARRSPPKGVFTHDVGRIVPAPVPSPIPVDTEARCPALDALRIEGGLPAQHRLLAGLRPLCSLTGPSITQDLRDAIAGLETAVIRFAAFQRSGEEATSDVSTRRIYVNLRFARTNTPTVLVTPILVHEGWHVRHGNEPATASGELHARMAELEACRQLIDRDKWIRNCLDADRLVALGERRAISLLVAAGFAAG